LELPADVRQFDYDTISDVILHMRYTARKVGGLLKQQATLELQTALNEFVHSEGQQGLAQLFSLRHEFPTEWHRFLNPPAGAAAPRSFTLNLGEERFPFVFANRGLTINAIELFIRVKDDFADTHNENTLKLTLAPTEENAQPPDLLPLAPWNGLLRAAWGFNYAPGTWTLSAWLDNGDHLDPTPLESVVVVCHYSVGT
jgi:Tc toxin complex TcA C-terminal TcB-binding domain